MRNNELSEWKIGQVNWTAVCYVIKTTGRLILDQQSSTIAHDVIIYVSVNDITQGLGEITEAMYSLFRNIL